MIRPIVSCWYALFRSRVSLDQRPAWSDTRIAKLVPLDTEGQRERRLAARTRTRPVSRLPLHHCVEHPPSPGVALEPDQDPLRCDPRVGGKPVLSRGFH